MNELTYTAAASRTDGFPPSAVTHHLMPHQITPASYSPPGPSDAQEAMRHHSATLSQPFSSLALTQLSQVSLDRQISIPSHTCIRPASPLCVQPEGHSAMARVRLGHLVTCALACLAATNATEIKISRWMDPAECASFELPREITTQSHYQLLLAARSPDIRHAFQSKTAML